METHLNNVAGLGSVSLIKVAPAQMVSCELYDTFKNTYFVEHMRVAASVTTIIRFDSEINLEETEFN